MAASTVGRMACPSPLRQALPPVSHSLHPPPQSFSPSFLRPLPLPLPLPLSPHLPRPSRHSLSVTACDSSSNGTALSSIPRPPRPPAPRTLNPKPSPPPPRALHSSQGSVLLDSPCALPPPLNPKTVNSEPSPELLRVAPESLQYEAGMLGAVPQPYRNPANGSGYGHRTGENGAVSVPDSVEGNGADCVEYLRRILTSQVYDVAVESPLEKAEKLSERMGNNIYLKREDMQQVFSFKLRGAYNMMARLSPAQLARGVVCSSAGNHAQGVALAAARLGCRAAVAMPRTTPAIKWRQVERLGAEVVLVGDAYDEAQAYAKQRALDEGLIFIPPFDHPDIIAGQGTVGMEILRQHPGPLHAVFVPVGGGGLIAGIAAYIKTLRPEVRVIGVEPADANAMALSLHHGRRVQLEHAGGFADGVAVKVVGEETFRLSKDLVDGIVLVNRDAICAAIKDVFEEVRSILEPAGALALAGAKAYCEHYGLAGQSVVAVASGANMNFERLRLVTDLADVGARREAVLATALPERPGSFKRFCQLLDNMNITEFKYRYSDESAAHVLYSVGLHEEQDLRALIGRMDAAGLATTDMTGNDLAKDHLRHLVGGRTKVPNEVLYRFVFPERPGALMKFLDMLSPRWNITLFHYRRQGEMGANILAGLQVLPEEEAEFALCAAALGYEHKDERNNPAFLMFMR